MLSNIAPCVFSRSSQSDTGRIHAGLPRVLSVEKGIVTADSHERGEGPGGRAQDKV